MATGQVIIPATFIRATSFLHNDAGETALVCGINMTSGVAIGECYKVPKNLVGIVKIGSATVGGKDDSVSGIVYKDGSARMFVSEADAPAGSGTTSAVRVYDFPNAFAPSAPTSGTVGSIDSVLRTVMKAFLVALRDAAVKAIALIP